MTEPAQTDLRRERRLAKFGTRTPICAYCGETAIECLELHHVLGEELDPDLKEIRCRNCHRKIEWRRDELGLTRNGIRSAPTVSTNESLRLRLLGLAESQESQAQALRGMAEELRETEVQTVVAKPKGENSNA